MNVMYVRVVGWDCDACRDALVTDCVNAGLELNQEFTMVPADWPNRECPHGKNGITMEVLASERPLSDEVADLGVDSETELFDFSGSGGWRDLYPDTADGGKGTGYPARDTGLYGSYPQFDGGDDN